MCQEDAFERFFLSQLIWKLTFQSAFINIMKTSGFSFNK